MERSRQTPVLPLRCGNAAFPRSRPIVFLAGKVWTSHLWWLPFGVGRPEPLGFPGEIPPFAAIAGDLRAYGSGLATRLPLAAPSTIPPAKSVACPANRRQGLAVACGKRQSMKSCGGGRRAHSRPRWDAPQSHAERKRRRLCDGSAQAEAKRAGPVGRGWPPGPERFDAGQGTRDGAEAPGIRRPSRGREPTPSGPRSKCRHGRERSKNGLWVAFPAGNRLAEIEERRMDNMRSG